MSRHVPHTSGRRASNHYGKRPKCDYVWRSDTNCHISHASRRHETNHNRWTPQANRAAHMWHEYRNHRTDMHIQNPGCHWHHFSPNSLTQGPSGPAYLLSPKHLVELPILAYSNRILHTVGNAIKRFEKSVYV